MKYEKTWTGKPNPGKKPFSYKVEFGLDLAIVAVGVLAIIIIALRCFYG